jgi:hypothetical protein
MRKSTVSLRYWGWHYHSPLVKIPDEFAMRTANGKTVELTPKRDPKNKWGLHQVERQSVHPSVWGLERSNWANYNNKGGIICDVPPVPVYRKSIWCMGHIEWKQHHPRIFIKCPPGFVVSCKWCRLKFINMSTEDDNDDNWQKEWDKIAQTPETMEQLMTPYRQLGGRIRKSNFQDGKLPHPEVYKTVYNPNVFYAKYMPEKVVEEQAQVEAGTEAEEATAQVSN